MSIRAIAALVIAHKFVWDTMPYYSSVKTWFIYDEKHVA